MSSLSWVAVINKKISLIIILWIFFSIIMSVFLLRELLWNQGLPYTRDLVFPYDLGSFGANLDTWDEIHSQYNAETNKIPLYYMFLVGSNLFGSQLTVKLFFITVLSLVSFVPFLSIYLLFKDKVPSVLKLFLICAIPSLLYLLNPWVVDRISNHIYMVLGMAVTPLVFVLYIKLLESRKEVARTFPNLIIVVLLMTLCSFSTHNLLYLIPMILITGTYYYLSSGSVRRRNILFSTIAILSLYVLLNSYWIWPNIYSITSGSIGPSYAFSIIEVERLSQFNSPSNVFQMIGGGAWKNVLMEGPGATSIIFTFLIPIFAIAALLLYPKNKVVLLLGVLFVIAFLLALGTKAPVPIYDILLTSPLSGIAWLLRDPSRIIQYVVMIYSLLISFTLYSILQNRRVQLRNILVVIIAVSILSSSAAFTFFNNAGNRLIPSEIPSEYHEVRAMLSQDTDNFKVLWLPERQYQFYDWNGITDEVAGDVYSVSSPVPTYGLTTVSSGVQFWNYIYSNVLLDYRTNELGHFLSLYNIKYIIIHNDLRGQQKVETDRILKILGFQDDIELTQTIGRYSIFTNKAYQAETSAVSTYVSKSDQKQPTSIPQLNSNALSLDAKKLSDWKMVTPNNRISTDSLGENNEQLTRWDTSFTASQERYEIRLDLNHLNVESYDKLSINFLPTNKLENSAITVALYTNNSTFYFSRNDVKTGNWTTELFDLRASKLSQASGGGAPSFKDVTGIGVIIFKKYYPSVTENTIYIRDISFTTNSTPPFDVGEMLEDWPSIERRFDIISSVQTGRDNNIRLRVNATQPYILALADSYDPLWKARIIDSNGESSNLNPIPLYSAINGFVINKLGIYEIVLYYTPQTWLEYGSVMSTITVAFVVYLMWLIKQGNTKVISDAARRLAAIYGGSLPNFIARGLRRNSSS